jgi:hypothetical protein
MVAGGLAALAAAAAAAFWRRPRALDPETLAARWAEPLPPAPPAGLRVYHLGHSLVGRDMPAMLTQLAQAAGFAGHAHASQLGWGASLDQHRRGEVPGHAEENAHPAHVPAGPALAAGRFDAVVLTEMVELRDAIRWHDSPAALAHWARAAAAGNPRATVWLYETWHRLDDPAGWLSRIETDRTALWEGTLIARAMARAGTPPIRLLPAGQALAAVVRAAEAGALPGLGNRRDLFSDEIHLNDRGAAVVALAHFATLYRRSPEGLPPPRLRADGTPAATLPETALAAVQHLVWQAVRRYPSAGFTES